MPKTINGLSYYAPAEAAKRDRNDWRLFSEDEVSEIRRQAETVEESLGKSAL